MSGTKGVFLKKKAIYKSSPELKEHFTSKEKLNECVARLFS